MARNSQGRIEDKVYWHLRLGLNLKVTRHGKTRDSKFSCISKIRNLPIRKMRLTKIERVNQTEKGSTEERRSKRTYHVAIVGYTCAGNAEDLRRGLRTPVMRPYIAAKAVMQGY
ncbi:hypothetical protein WN51_02507 [Melipona quadrifasciata]|uniref:Uncharacterized protein n=1 Tax=Melipona quadrifasciata TaxID=166423 RepID=A0A0N0U437_9HYME|nr:hypothetical protein WN51_02507 [Melipona quadrifasciata]